MQPLRSWMLFSVAQLFTFFKRNTRALQAFEAVLKVDPRHQRAWSCAAFLHAEKGRYDQAIPAFEQALALKPGDAPAHFNLGFVLQRAGRHDEALGHFQRAIDLDPALDRAWYGMGLSLSQQDRYQEAIARLKEAARLQPFNPYARYYLAAAWFKLGEPENVQKEYRRVKKFDPRIAERLRVDFGVPKDPD